MVWNIKNTTQLKSKRSFSSAMAMCSSSLTAAAAGLIMVACASTPPPTQQITAAESAISHAEQAQVADFASPELSEAREKLAAARTAVSKDEMTHAARFAEQAQLNADLAAA